MDPVVIDPLVVLTNWHATFTDLRLANVTLQDWLAWHTADRKTRGVQ